MSVIISMFLPETLAGRAFRNLRKTITKYCVVFKKGITIPDNDSGRILSPLRILAELDSAAVVPSRAQSIGPSMPV